MAIEITLPGARVTTTEWHGLAERLRRRPQADDPQRARGARFLSRIVVRIRVRKITLPYVGAATRDGRATTSSGPAAR